MNNNFDIERFLSLEGYATDIRQERRKGSGGSQEFFTPPKLVIHMGNKISENQWNNPEANFLEPCLGNGNFVIYIIYNKIKHGSTWLQALSHTFGVELMSDNVKETHQRVHQLLAEMGIQYDKQQAQQIMDHNLVCSDFFKWNFQNWCPIKEQKAMPLF